MIGAAPLLAGQPRTTLEALRAELGPQLRQPPAAGLLRLRGSRGALLGAFRAGKSRIGCEKAYYLARRYPGIPIGIFRKVLPACPPRRSGRCSTTSCRASAITASNQSELVRAGQRQPHLALRPRPRSDHRPALQGRLGRARLGLRRRGRRGQRGRLGDGQGPTLLARHRLPPDRRRHQPGQPDALAQAAVHAAARRRASISTPRPSTTRRPAGGLPRRGRRARTRRLPPSPLHLGRVGRRGGRDLGPARRPGTPARPGPCKRVWRARWGFVHAFACEVVGQTGERAPGRAR